MSDFVTLTVAELVWWLVVVGAIGGCVGMIVVLAVLHRRDALHAAPVPREPNRGAVLVLVEAGNDEPDAMPGHPERVCALPDPADETRFGYLLRRWAQ